MTSSSDNFMFSSEDDGTVQQAGTAGVWQVLVVDDDPDVHETTALALRNLTIDGRKLELVHAHSAGEALSVLSAQNDFAVILLDVVMESEDAGLKLVHRIRGELNNRLLRIILRTGQPGYAPEMDTIRDYDINDYKTKTELTRTRLFTSMTTAIRTYRQMREQEELRIGLELVVSASTELTQVKGLQLFAEGVVVQLSALLGLSPEGLICAEQGDAHKPARVIAAAGQFSHLVNQPLELLPVKVRHLLQQCLQQRCNVQDDGLALYFPTENPRGLAAWVELKRPLQDTDMHLLQVFSSSMSVGFENVMLYTRMRDQAYCDPLLQIPNLNQLLLWLADPALVCNGNTLAVIDIDDFSAINDTLGHSFGDNILRAVYHRLSNVLAACRIARIGSDIFAVIGPDDSLTPDAVKNLFITAFICAEEPLRLSATTGFVQLQGRTPAGSELLKDAHLALKQAKLSNRGGSACFSEELGIQARERIRLLTSLREAFNQTQMFLLYQPKIDLSSGKTSGFEALIRWRNADGDLIPPDRFIPLAEKSGMIIAIGYFVLRSACDFLRRLHVQGYTWLTMAINVSQVQLKEADFVNRLKIILAASHVPPSAVELEITESTAAEDAAMLIERLQEIRALGVKIAIDDFGTGFSSLSILRHMPATRLKIDRSFINEMTSDDSIPRLVISLGHSMDMQITAEGVETKEQRDLLQTLGCDEAQGWLYAPALDEKKAEEWLGPVSR